MIFVPLPIGEPEIRLICLRLDASAITIGNIAWTCSGRHVHFAGSSELVEFYSVLMPPPKLRWGQKKYDAGEWAS